MKKTFFLAFLFCLFSHAQNITFDFDNATVNAATDQIEQTVIVNGVQFKLIGVHETLTGLGFQTYGTNDQWIKVSNGTRTLQQWRFTLKRNGLNENFDYISTDYFNSGNFTHTILAGDINNNAITGQTQVSPGSNGALTPSTTGASFATGISSFVLFGFTANAHVDVHFNDIELAPVSLLSNHEVAINSVNYYQDHNQNWILESEHLEGAQIVIYNYTGQKIKSFEPMSSLFKIQTQNFKPGLYFAHITLNQVTQVIKFMK